MKKTSSWATGLFLLCLTVVSCTNSDDDLNPTGSNATQVLNQGGTWKVTWYWDKDKDETSDFSGYTFEFQTSGTFVAQGNGTTASGTWHTGSDDGSQRLTISSGSPSKPLIDLDDDWIIVSLSEKKIELKDDNDEHLEELHFEKL